MLIPFEACEGHALFGFLLGVVVGFILGRETYRSGIYK